MPCKGEQIEEHPLNSIQPTDPTTTTGFNNSSDTSSGSSSRIAKSPPLYSPARSLSLSSISSPGSSDFSDDNNEDHHHQEEEGVVNKRSSPSVHEKDDGFQVGIDEKKQTIIVVGGEAGGVRKHCGSGNSSTINTDSGHSSTNGTSTSSGIGIDFGGSLNSTSSSGTGGRGGEEEQMQQIEAQAGPGPGRNRKDSNRDFIKILKQHCAPNLEDVGDSDNEKELNLGSEKLNTKRKTFGQSFRAERNNSFASTNVSGFLNQQHTRPPGFYTSTPLNSPPALQRMRGYPRHQSFYDVAVGAAVTNRGIISIGFIGGTRVEIAPNGGIRMFNELARTIIALSPSGTESAMFHPSGRVYQYGSKVEVSTNHEMHNKVAKMWYKGISFALESGALVYFLDSAGTRTIHDVFSDLCGDFTLPVFSPFNDNESASVAEASNLLKLSQHWTDQSGTTENWIINGIKIKRTPDDIVRVMRHQNKYEFRICGNGLASMCTPFIYSTASDGKAIGPEASHLFVRRGERRLHYDGSYFILRNGGHSAGFDDHNEFKVF